MVRVCDAIMGAGKTQSAITQMLEDEESQYIYITPYLNEVTRVKTACDARNFYEPTDDKGRKIDDLHRLLRAKRNIVSTHALFKAYTDETVQLIRDGGYKLIMDEVADVVEKIEIHKDDIDMMLGQGLIQVDEIGCVRWMGLEYDGRFSGHFKDMCMTGHVFLYGRHLMLWTFPVGVFEGFREVTVLTYLFDAQIQKYYFDLHGIQVQKIGTAKVDGQYRFTDKPVVPEYVATLRDKVHILDNKKMNDVGNGQHDLSVSWYERVSATRGKPKIEKLRKNIYNFYRGINKSPSSRNLWTTFKGYEDVLAGKGYAKGFLSFNARATNEYKDRTHLAYCVNLFYNPFMKNYFLKNNIVVEEDMWALSEMVQWVWRSAIRDGKEIWIYIPSARMRGLLRDWLEEQASIVERQ